MGHRRWSTGRVFKELRRWPINNRTSPLLFCRGRRRTVLGACGSEGMWMRRATALLNGWLYRHRLRARSSHHCSLWRRAYPSRTFGRSPRGPQGTSQIASRTSRARELLVTLCLGFGTIGARYRRPARRLGYHAIGGWDDIVVVLVFAMDGVMSLQEVAASKVSACTQAIVQAYRPRRVHTASQRTCGR